MIAYLDTSSLVKLYVEEAGSSEVASLVADAEVTATSMVAHAEARAAFARRFREKAFTSKAYGRIKEAFSQDWPRYFIVGVTEDLVRQAGDLAEKHALRGFDAIHLASALTLSRELAAPILFSCFDSALEKAFYRENPEPGNEALS